MTTNMHRRLHLGCGEPLCSGYYMIQSKKRKPVRQRIKKQNNRKSAK